MLQDDWKLDNVTSVEARTSSIVTFRVEDDQMQAILTKLHSIGVGVQFGFCDVMSLTPGTALSKQTHAKKKRRVGRILERSTEIGTAVPVAEMYAHIEANATLSRDSIGMLLISSAVAGIGLAADSGTYVVASMLLSPLMGPIIGCAFGFVLRDRNLFINGFLNELFALTITLLLGMIIGAVLSPYAAALNWPTSEMRSRGQAIQLLFGAIVAALSGAGVALAESNANISSVVGIAIAAALLPPTVNAGICTSYVILGQYFVSDDVLGEEQKLIFYEIAVGSGMLLWINIVFIYFSAVVVFKIKKVDKFQIIRRVDELSWKNLPRVQRSPTSRSVTGGGSMAFPVLERQESTSTVSSSRSLLSEVPDHRHNGHPESKMPLSPLRRRGRVDVVEEETKERDHVNAV
ncbi:hypothetical protein Poli38472_002280 [Pythium oligandrum]|uniref:DUF389 domain-containing protein n=1 Tax=Pythium oligandrum TaxID=41045 RepID=A0A8K1CGX4_PYTOL|nr:hypothetical protein Poli38472_002280 [Pythium oligandrum]|eukprot:TMW63339.1 hypothetical protein Poli38472_002280 [Pythium oligandrum]